MFFIAHASYFTRLIYQHDKQYAQLPPVTHFINDFPVVIDENFLLLSCVVQWSNPCKFLHDATATVVVACAKIYSSLMIRNARKKFHRISIVSKKIMKRILVMIPADTANNVDITVTPYWARWRLKSPSSRLFFQAQIKENIIASRHWPLCREFRGDWWIPRTKVQ